MKSSHHSKTQSSADISTAHFAGKNPKIHAQKNRQSVEVNTLLKSQLSHLWPTISNITVCQRECVAALPQLFLYCQVMYIESDRLTLSAPNSALASKLKQQLPKLQTSLQKAGWRINAIRIKVQVNPMLKKVTQKKRCQLSARALHAFDGLEKNLTQSGSSSELLAALRNLINRER